jgi:hypothetical protein
MCFSHFATCLLQIGNLATAEEQEERLESGDAMFMDSPVQLLVMTMLHHVVSSGAVARNQVPLSQLLGRYITLMVLVVGKGENEGGPIDCLEFVDSGSPILA